MDFGTVSVEGTSKRGRGTMESVERTARGGFVASARISLQSIGYAENFASARHQCLSPKLGTEGS